ncbi:hypothetical protein FVE88_01575 [Ectopseudomonas mendocina]|nr:hypothetical protein [Pseudomonas mendocina]TXR41164.1 hypothetical protein FVE88_01575 [Pseudomonas mendocina]
MSFSGLWILSDFEETGWCDGVECTLPLGGEPVYMFTYFTPMDWVIVLIRTSKNIRNEPDIGLFHFGGPGQYSLATQPFPKLGRIGQIEKWTYFF